MALATRKSKSFETQVAGVYELPEVVLGTLNHSIQILSYAQKDTLSLVFQIIKREKSRLSKTERAGSIKKSLNPSIYPSFYSGNNHPQPSRAPQAQHVLLSLAKDLNLFNWLAPPYP